MALVEYYYRSAVFLWQQREAFLFTRRKRGLQGGGTLWFQTLIRDIGQKSENDVAKNRCSWDLQFLPSGHNKKRDESAACNLGQKGDTFSLLLFLVLTSCCLAHEL